MSIYEENGYANRREYLDAMAEDYGLENMMCPLWPACWGRARTLTA